MDHECHRSTYHAGIQSLLGNRRSSRRTIASAPPITAAATVPHNPQGPSGEWEAHTPIKAAPARKAPPPSPKGFSPPKRGSFSPRRLASAIPQATTVAPTFAPNARQAGVAMGGGSAPCGGWCADGERRRERPAEAYISSTPRHGRRAPSRSAWRARPHSRGTRARSRSESAFTHRQTREVFDRLEYFSSKVATIYCRHEARRLGGLNSNTSSTT